MQKGQKIDIIGACCDLGVHVNGANLAPEILEKEIDSKLYNKIYNVYKQENIIKELEIDNKKKNLIPLNEFNKRLYKQVKQVVDEGNFPFTIGGDHAIAIASDLAVISKYQNLGIIWFDAHGDYHTFKTTMSGNLHGLPFAAVTGYEKTLLSDFHGSGPRFNPHNAVILGGHDIDLPEELANLKDAGVTILSTKDIKEQGYEVIYKKAFEIASNGTNGRKSGGKTGSTVIIIHSGLLPELKNDSINFSLLAYFLRFDSEEVLSKASRTAFNSSSRLICCNKSKIASAPILAEKSSP